MDFTKIAPLGEVVLTADGGVVKKIYTKGEDAYPAPKYGELVHVLYEGRLASNNAVFDSTTDPSDAFTFQIGMGEVIGGWDVGIASMRLGERAELVLKPDYAYGAEGCDDDIPPNATLIFKVELLRIAQGPLAARLR